MYCYIHIPFCDNKCKYCRFASIGVTQESMIIKYVKFLYNSISDNSLIKSKINRDLLSSVYFGGGTPTSLNNKQLLDIITILKKKYGFKKNIEITLETTPDKVSKNNLICWKNIGINRLSIGVQTLNSKSLNEIGRGNKGDIISALDNIKNVGFNNVSLDFIVGLPYVKVGEIKRDIQFILDNYSFVKHFSVYMLEEYYEKTLSSTTIIGGEKRSSLYENIIYPRNWKNFGIKDEDYLGEYIEVKKFLQEKGFYSYEISNFAKPGFECKHNKAYWNHSEILAFGLGSHGFLNGIRYSNCDNFKGFYNSETNFEEKITKNDIFLEKVMFGLRTTGLKKDIYKKLNKEKIIQFIENGFLKMDDDILKLENKGILVMDYILSEII